MSENTREAFRKGHSAVAVEATAAGHVLSVATPDLAEQLAVAKFGPLSKLDGTLTGLFWNAQGSGADAVSVSSDYVVIDAVSQSGDGDGLLKALESLGLVSGGAFGAMASGLLPVTALESVAAQADLAFARSSASLANVGLTTSQGDASMEADVARATYGVDGSGLKIGVLSDSYDNKGGAGTDIFTDDLPDLGVTVLDDLSGGGSDEGRAMLQLIHDVAPGADLSFHTAFTGQANFAQGILDLRTDGADVIVDDVIYFAEPFFQDGIIAQAVDQAVADGALYFSSAGNQARDSYESAFVDSGIDLDLGSFQVDAHDFDPGAGVDAFQAVTIGGGSTITISFQWDEAFFSVSGGLGAQNDTDIFLFDSAETTLVDSSSSNNIGGDPLEILQFTNNGSTNTFNIAIGRFTGADPGLMKYVTFGSFNILEHDTNSGTTAGHAAASGGQAVAAAFYDETPAFGTNPPLVEPFSSAGPTTILFDTAGNRLSVPDVRQTPQITALDGTNTTFFGSDISQDPDGFPNFFGTSAAAPHAAAAAALIIDGVPGLLPEDVYRVMQVTAIDMDDPLTAGFDVGVDSRTGYGLIQADDALAALNADPAGTAGDDVIAGRSATDAISGGGGSDALYGLSGDDTLTGGTGDDVLEGGAGSDTFVIASGDGADIIVDFFSGPGVEDIIDLTGIAGIDDFADVQAAASLDGSDTVLAFSGGDSLRLLDVAPTDLVADDFLTDNTSEPLTPDLVAGLNLWLDASDAGTVIDTGSDGDVDAWTDKSAAGNAVDQGSAARQPGIDAAGINGLTSIGFDGADDYLAAADSAALNTGGPYDGKTLTFAFETGADVASRQVLYEQGGSSRGLNTYVDGGQMYLGGWNRAETVWGPSFVNATLSANTTYVASLVVDGVSGTLEGYLNGVSTGALAGVDLLHNHGGDIGLGAANEHTYFHDGASTVAEGFFFDGEIGEVAFYDGALSAADRAGVEQYLADKWLTDPNNTPPVALDDGPFPATEDVPLTILAVDLLVNDSDGDSDPLQIASVAGVVGGTPVLNGSGAAVDFAPAADFSGPASFTYTVSDGRGGLDTATVNVDIAPVNDPPDAVDDGPVLTAEETAVVIDVLANDDDVDGDGIAIDSVTQGAGGSVAINPDDTVTYTPNTGFSGADSFTYTITDGTGAFDTATVSVTVGNALTPDLVAGLNLWLDASDAGTVIDTGSDGDVDAWTDKSAAGNAVDQGSAARQPGIVAAGINGLTSIGFDGADDYLAVADSAALNTGGPYDGKTLTFAFETGADVASRQVLYEQGGSSRGLNTYVDGGQMYLGGWNRAETVWGPSFVDATVSANTTYVASLVVDGVSGTLEGFLNGVSMGALAGVDLLYGHIGDIGLGAANEHTYFHDGASTVAEGFFFDGEIGEVAFYDGALSAADRAGVEQYLADKWLGGSSNTALAAGQGNDTIIDFGAEPSRADVIDLTGVESISNSGDIQVAPKEQDTVLSFSGGDDSLAGDNGQDVLAGGSASSLNIADVLDMGGTGEGGGTGPEVFAAGAAPDLQSLLPDPVSDPLI